MRARALGLAATLAALATTLAAPAGAQDIAAGERAFGKCRPCHAVGEDARNKVGPVLNGLDGRKAGTVAGYGYYSEANKTSGIVWNEDTFKDYITNPRAKVPGTNMSFTGIAGARERADLWAYLKQFGADGKIKN